MAITRIHRYIDKSRKRTGDLFCKRCQTHFSGLDAYDRHLVWYPDLRNDPNNPGKDWCHQPEEVGLLPRSNQFWGLPPSGDGPLALDPAITAGGGIPRFPRA